MEEQVEKGGMQLTDVINKEHFNIAIKKLSMQNCITSIKTVQRMDMQDVFENVNKVEKLLKQDEIYVKMDFKLSKRRKNKEGKTCRLLYYFRWKI